MTALYSFLAASLFAWCFFCTGELSIGRRSRGLVEWNQSFLVGLSVVTLLFVPASALLRQSALLATLAGTLLAGAYGLRRFFYAPEAPVRERRNLDLWSQALLGLLALLLLQFAVQNSRLSYLWDGFQIWGTKAMIFFWEGGLGKHWVAPGEQERLLAYPHMVPLYEALVVKLQGSFEWNALKPVFVFFYLSLLVSTFQAARCLVTTRIALGATAFLAMVPAVSTRFNVGGYADMPQSVLVAAAVAALLEASLSPQSAGWRSPAPWLLGGVAFVKNEGLVLALIIGTFVIAQAALPFPGAGLRLLAFLRKYREAVAAALIALGTRWLALRWLQAPDPQFGPLDGQHLQRAVENVFVVPALCAHEMFAFWEWGLFWPVFWVALVVVLWIGNRNEQWIAVGVTVSVSSYMSIFYFTNWDIALHISQAFSRLLVQIAPIGAVSMGTAYARLQQGRRT